MTLDTPHGALEPPTLTDVRSATAHVYAAMAPSPLLRHPLLADALGADVHVKHAVPLGNWTLEEAARDTFERGLADALIVSGTGTGIATDLDDVRRVRAVCPRARILLGSGVTQANVHDFLPLVDGVIVGTSLKRGGKSRAPVDAARVRALARALRR